jgi:hypothetical protein
MLEIVPFKSLNSLLCASIRMPNVPEFRPIRRVSRAVWAIAVTASLCLAMFTGCSGLRPKPKDQYVYVTAKQTFLRDRVAAVSNRTGTVTNGDRLVVLEHGRRFYRVRTEKAVATQDIFDAFNDLGQTHKGDPAVASAVVRDDVNLHLKPGKDTARLYRLAEGDKLQLLTRATLPKPVPGGAPAKPAAATKPVVAKGAPAASTAEPAALPPPIAMEDWWLARDAHGRTGWLLSRMLDVDVPDSVGRYAEGQRIVGAYVLATVHDEGVDSPNKDIPIYLTVLSPYLAGLPYDFDQVRVFTWNLKMHRYETAFREKNVEGYLPVAISIGKDPYGKAVLAQTPLPTFTYRVLAADAGTVVPDPVTGTVTPGRTIAKTFRLEGNLVRRLAPPGSKDEPEAHPVVEPKKDKAGKKKH